MNDFYHEELTDASFQELLRFASWMNRFFGHYPTIVGSWAVWCYTRGPKAQGYRRPRSSS
jgi:hypothetical protein